MKDALKTLFFKPSWYTIFVNPYFIARKNLYKEILIFSKNIRRKKILDLGCGSKPYASLFEENIYIGIEIENGGHKNSSKSSDIFFDGQVIPFDDVSFDVVICTQVLEHAEDPDRLIKEAYRVLKYDGLLYLTCPFVWPEHEVPYDFRRYTQFGLRKLAGREFNLIHIKPTAAGIFATCGQLLSAFLFELVGKNFFLRTLMALLICFPIQLAFLILDFLFRHKGMNLDYVVIARKNEP